MKKCLFLLGFIAGVLIVRALFLDEIQVMGWDMFWNGLIEGELMDMELVFKSKTLLKCLAGGSLCGVLAAVLGNAISSKTPTEGKETEG
jgi:hypothetical protein